MGMCAGKTVHLCGLVRTIMVVRVGRRVERDEIHLRHRVHAAPLYAHRFSVAQQGLGEFDLGPLDLDHLHVGKVPDLLPRHLVALAIGAALGALELLVRVLQLTLSVLQLFPKRPGLL